MAVRPSPRDDERPAKAAAKAAVWMPVRIGINGFGRIGRQCVRILTLRGPPFSIQRASHSPASNKQPGVRRSLPPN